MKRRSRLSSKWNTIIDLTSLLDVIFIFLFIVMMSSQQSAAEATAKVEDLQSNLTEAEATNEELEQELSDTKQSLLEAEKASADNASSERIDDDLHEKISDLSDYVELVDIDISYLPSDPSIRTIKVVNGNNQIFKRTITNKSDDAVWQELEKDLTSLAEKDNEYNIPVIITVIHDNALNRDVSKVSSILSDIQNSYDNVYNK